MKRNLSFKKDETTIYWHAKLQSGMHRVVAYEMLRLHSFSSLNEGIIGHLGVFGTFLFFGENKARSPSLNGLLKKYVKTF